MQPDLFGVSLPEGVKVLRGFALPQAANLLADIERIAGSAPFRHMVTPGGQTMSAAMTNAGFGWVTDRKGYRYSREDPVTGAPWPDLPPSWRDLAGAAAHQAGFAFTPDGCLINRYQPGARMGLHQDRDEQDFGAPIVSVSLGLPVVFLFGGMNRTDPVVKMPLEHGDVVVWGGPVRLAFHGVAPLKPGDHPLIGAVRYNLTLRKAR